MPFPLTPCRGEGKFFGALGRENLKLQRPGKHPVDGVAAPPLESPCAMVNSRIHRASTPSGIVPEGLRLFPLALAAVWACTVLSVEIAPPRLDASLWRIGPDDLFVNILLYAPLGVALRRRGALFAIITGATLSCGAELTQLFYPDRFTAGTDVAANIAGVFIGWALSNRFSRRYAWGFDPIPLSRSLAVFAGVLFIVTMILLTRPGRPSGFANWNPRCRLIVADELTRDRPWSGRIHALAVFDDCLDRTDIQRLSRGPLGETENSFLASRNPVFFTRLPEDLDSIRGVPLMAESGHDALFHALVKSGSLTILVWFRSASVDQWGPARIAGYSTSPWDQNFSLGQEGRDVIFRLRTPTTNPGGYFPQTRTRPILVKDDETIVAAAYDGRNVRVYVNGVHEARMNLCAQGRISPFLSDHGLPVAAWILGALTGIAALAMSGLSRVSLLSAAARGAFGGFLGGAALVAAGGAGALPEFGAWIPVVAGWSGAVAGLAWAPTAS